LAAKLVEVLVGKKVISATAATRDTAVWTDKGELFTFGYDGSYAQLGHGGEETVGTGGKQYQGVPRLIKALAGEHVVGAAAKVIDTQW